MARLLALQQSRHVFFAFSVLGLALAHHNRPVDLNRVLALQQFFTLSKLRIVLTHYKGTNILPARKLIFKAHVDWTLARRLTLILQVDSIILLSILFIVNLGAYLAALTLSLDTHTNLLDVRF